jgi:hypothetical protein
MPLKGLSPFELAFPFANALEIRADSRDSLDKLKHKLITECLCVSLRTLEKQLSYYRLNTKNSPDAERGYPRREAEKYSRQQNRVARVPGMAKQTPFNFKPPRSILDSSMGTHVPTLHSSSSLS